MPDKIDQRYEMGHCADSSPDKTESEWEYVLELCRRQYPIGLGVLDSFLSGPDIARRIDFVERESKANEWLRIELRDTLHLDHSKDWSPVQLQRIKKATGLA